MTQDLFSDFASTCEKIRQTSSKNAKIAAIAKYLSQLHDERSLRAACLFLSGSLFPKGSGVAMHLGAAAILRILSQVAPLSRIEIQQVYLKNGDLGALAEYALSKKHTSPLFSHSLTVTEVHEQLTKIAGASGTGSSDSKDRILSGLLINCSALEARYLVKVTSGELRIGSVEGLVELAVARAFGRELEHVRRAMLVSDDISEVAVFARNNALDSITMKPLSPLSFMLADVMFSADEIANYYDKPLYCEFKYDGVRLQLHKSGTTIKLFSRTLDDVTASFPEIAASAATFGNDVILDGEAIAFSEGRPLKFQMLQRRLRRKHTTKELISDIPVIYIPYDIMYLGGKQLIAQPLSERKMALATLNISKYSFSAPHPQIAPPAIVIVEHSVVTSAEEIDGEFEKSRLLGHEGLVVKDPDAEYHPGRRGRHWSKLKRELETIDAVIVCAEYGHGKRAGTLSDYTFAVRDGKTLRTIGKAYSGLTDTEIGEMTSRLQALTTKDEGYRIIVKPEIVLEIAFDDIQKSSRHDSGFALRFPRIKRIRNDKRLEDIDTIVRVKDLCLSQNSKSR